MKRTFAVFLVLILISGSIFLSSCKGKDATTGSLTITALIKGIEPAADKQIGLATSRENLENKIYEATGYTNNNGSVIFRELLPKYYWYGIEGWSDYGAAEVFTGYDGSVILWLNSPSTPKNN
jgi:hypothetical protein